MKICYVNGCYNSSQTSVGRSFFIFPRKSRYPKICRQWVEFTQNKSINIHADRQWGYICDVHFKDEDFYDETKTKLCPGTVPSLFPPLSSSTTFEESAYKSMKTEVPGTSEFHTDITDDGDLNQVEISASNDINIKQEPYEIEISSDLDNPDILYPTLDIFCRICGNETSPAVLIPIFTPRGCRLEVHQKISTHLKIEVVEDDGLPQQICSSCICHLNVCQQLVQVSQEADVKLRNIFQNGIQKNEKSIQPVPHRTFSLKNPQTIGKDLDITTTLDNSALQEINLGLMENDLIDESLLEFDKEEIVETVNCDENHMENETSTVPSNVNKIPEHFLCDLCGKIFDQVVEFRKHKRKHQRKRHSCTLCNKSFCSKMLLIEHGNVHTGLRPYNCSECDKKFHKQAHLEQHQRTHSIDYQKEVCEMCGRMFSTHSSLLTHLKRHQENKYKCRVCKEEFTMFYLMKAHRRMHTLEDIEKSRLHAEQNGERQETYLCDLCGKDFTQVLQFRRHRRTHTNKKHHCTLCTKIFRSKFLLSEHMNMHIGLRPYSCLECDKKFHKGNHLYQHMRTHSTDNQKESCQICGKKFNRRYNLMQHIKRHNEGQKYRCHVCKEEFDMLNVLLSHRKIHSREDIEKSIVDGKNNEDKIYTCEVCEKVFYKKSSLASHLRTHRRHIDKEEGKWRCELCGKFYSSRASLNTHNKSQHSSERPWCCQFCSEGFISEESLLIHEQIHTRHERIQDLPVTIIFENFEEQFEICK